ncbi:MAG: M24 family metallopeptidase [Lachnospiraceae bacterium]|nr:M24 family metallopeptidase [Lachnospiraceae bacterium]
MKKEGMDAYLIGMDDFHGSEYVGDYFKQIEYYSGFSGSAGTLLVVDSPEDREGSYLWTDGRYFLQASEQLEGSGTELMRMGMEGVPEIADFIATLYGEKLASANKFTLGFDGRCISHAFVKGLKKKAEERKQQADDPDIILAADRDLSGDLWQKDAEYPRPAMECRKIWDLDTKYAGAGRSEKLTFLREEMQKKGADVCVITALDETAWLMNLRGDDILYNPVFFSFLILTKDRVRLFADTKVNPDLASVAAPEGFSFEAEPYEDFWKALSEIPKEQTVMVDDAHASCRVMEILQGRDEKKLICSPSPVILKKALKNDTEIENIRQAHIKDGVAVTKWIYRMKEMCGEDRKTGEPQMTELSAAALLEDFRKQQTDYLGQSFAPIVAFRDHGAIIHYEPTEQTDVPIEFGKGDFLLADTGGHYLQGTTDITRTVSLGEPEKKKKEHYTAVLKGHLDLLDAVFLEGCAGSSLDHLAREPLYRMGLDFRHGTGHGVGYLLPVHEGPNGIRKKETKENRLYAGMITSDEPGFYLDGAYGIRLESLILSLFERETEYGRFLHFESLTMVPFDRDSILPGLLTDREKEVLNKYHETIRETISPYLEENEKSWLAKETAPF